VVTNQPGDPPSQDDHGTFTLSTCGGLVDGELYGPAFEATFMAGKTEITEDEIPIEEDYYVEGLEWADSLGADVVSTSLGYFDWYTFEDLDGNTCVTTIGVDIAVSHGIVCCTAAGNERNSPWGHIIAPADADSVIAVGAVEEDSSLASFSSPGPTYDGRIKPEVCAMGVLVYCADPGDIYGFTYASGTSLSTPLVGGAAALIVQAHPNWSPLMVREALMMTASQNYHPDNDFGWGIVDVLAAAQYSVTPEILTRTPENDTVQVYRDSSITFTVSAIDEDGDPLTYIFMIDDSVYAQSDSGIFTFSSSIIDTFTLTAIVQDLIQFADSTLWTIIVTEPPSVVKIANQPATFSLSIYPNPFNPETKINFNLPSAMQVQIVVYDITGREVAILINGNSIVL
jgi:hypothetical protein